MAIDLEIRDATRYTVATCRVMVPYRVCEVRSLVASDNREREKSVRAEVDVGDVCVIFDDRQTYNRRILHCRSGLLLTGYYADYLLFEDAPDVVRVCVAKPRN